MPDHMHHMNLFLAHQLPLPHMFDDEYFMRQALRQAQMAYDAGEVPVGAVVVVSQFTLMAAYKKGNRPSFIRAARPEQAIPLYEHFVAQVRTLLGKPVHTGTFGADMQVALVNDGPVTIWMDTADKE